MMRSLWTAASGMLAQQTNIDIISNNIANVNTSGFKKTRGDFQDLMYQNMRKAGTTTGLDNQVPTGINIGNGVRIAATQKLYTQGNFQSTGNMLDMAIEGEGFYQISMPDGTINYTRDGSFKRDSQGLIVTSDGYPLEPQITIPENATDVSISADGRVAVTIPGQTEPQEIGQIQSARFVNPAGLENIGKNLLKETAASGTPVVSAPEADGAGSIAQKYLEMSNVQIVEEMVNMIVAQRAYETNSKAITTSDSMLEIANGLKR